MAGVRLEFAQFGHFDYFNIYRNSVSTAIENLEQPIGTSSTMYYEDFTTEPNNDYYYRIGVVRDSIEEFSEEIHVRTEVMFDPPYNLIVEFRNDESNRLELNWSLDSFVDEQRYYCSETPIDPENLPVPKAVLAGDVRAYVDTDIEAGKTYYIGIGSVKNSVEKLSEIKEISTGGYRYYRIYITENNSEPYTAIQEIEMATVLDGGDITLPAMATNQSSYYALNSASRAIDNDISDIDRAWVTATGQSLPSWISIDLGASKDVVELRMWAQQYSYGLGRAPKSFIIQGSYNNIDWIDIKPFSNVVGWQLGTAKKFNLITGLIT